MNVNDMNHAWYENVSANGEFVIGQYYGIVILQCASYEAKCSVGVITPEQAVELVSATNG